MKDNVEIAQWKLSTVRWALIGMTESDYEVGKKDLSHLLVLLDEIEHELATVAIPDEMEVDQPFAEHRCARIS